MPTHIALLRGINVGGQKPVKMTDLQAHFNVLGTTAVQTYIQSGNVVFDHPESTAVKLRQPLEKHLSLRLGFAVTVLVKSSRDFAAIARVNPYDPALPELGRRMYVCFFEKAAAPAAIQSIQPLISPTERLVVIGDAGYAYYANGLGRAKLDSNVIERKLGLATLRNWNTVSALIKLAGAGNKSLASGR